MLAATPILAFGLPGYQEMLVLAVIGVLLFGRRLPEVGRQVGKAMTQLRRGLQDFKDQIDSDEDLRSAKSTIRDIRRGIEAPASSVAADPRRLFEHLTEEAMAAPGPETTEVEATPAASLFEQEADKLSSTAVEEPPAADPDRD